MICPRKLNDLELFIPRKLDDLAKKQDGKKHKKKRKGKSKRKDSATTDEDESGEDKTEPTERLTARKHVSHAVVLWYSWFIVNKFDLLVTVRIHACFCVDVVYIEWLSHWHE